MGEFHDAVSALVEAFSHGISIIGTQRGRRKKQQLAIDSTTRSAEESLNKSLKKNKTEVKNAYGKDLARFGPGFAAGDGKEAFFPTISHSGFELYAHMSSI